MYNIQDHATLINALKYVLLIFAVPWLAHAVSMCIFTAVIFLTDKLGIPWTGIPALKKSGFAGSRGLPGAGRNKGDE